MKHILFLFLIVSTVNAQSWQWGKRGGATDVLETISDLRQEEVYSIVTDSNKNIYVLSYVGKNGLNIDGVTKTNFGSNFQITDVALTSFACDGTYRWSKIIGGQSYDKVNSLEIDSNDNIYIAGKFGFCDATYPPRIENDILLGQTPTDCSLVFLAKFNNMGVLQWFKRPQPAGVTPSVGVSNTGSKGLASDGLGNSYWFLLLPPGTYADGAFVNTMTGNNYFIFKYDTNGNFISATPIDMQLSNGSIALSIQFARNPYNGYFYFTSRKGTASETAVVGGQTLAHTVFISCFNNLGQFQWMREDTATSPGSLFLYNLEFDSSNNIYVAGRMLGSNFNSFLGFSTPGSFSPGFVLKVNPTADTLLWSTYNNADALQRGAIALNGNEIGFTSICATTNFVWGSQTLNVSGTNQGTEVLLARFNKDTGACIQLTKIPGDVGYNDNGAALTADASGDYILGGGFGHQLTFATNTITATGSQSDFFVAKYSTGVCTPLNNDAFEDSGLEFYPNPVKDVLTINSKEELSYSIFTLTGTLICTGELKINDNRLDMSNYSSGVYVLRTVSIDGAVTNLKLVKQ